MNDHEKCQELLAGYRDGQLDDDDRIFVEAHLAQCADCQSQWQADETLTRLFDQWAAEEIEPPAGFRTKLFERLEVQPAPAERKSRSLPRLLPWAAAAVLLLALLPTTLHLTDQHAADQSAAQRYSFTSDEATPEDAAISNDSEENNSQPPLMTERFLTPTEDVATHKQSSQQTQADLPEMATEENNDADIMPFSDGTADQMPMLTSGYDLDNGQSEIQDDAAMENTLRSRAAGAVTIDWEALRAEEIALQERYTADLARLQSQYDEPPTDELAQAIAELQAQLERTAQRLQAIAAEDYAAYQAAGETAIITAE